jgi:lysophospholipid acyltransferase (LPLAT)-like uncharacterized protein
MKFLSIPLKYRLVAHLARNWLASCRPVTVQNYCARKLIASGTPVIVALWHQSLIYTPYHFSVYPGVVMVSGNRDAEWVAAALRMWGQIPVRCSRHKGGLKAIREMVRLMKERRIGAGIVADGSQGPAMKAQIGAIVLARDTGYPVIPTGFAAKRCVRFNSWDRMILPMPFSKVVMTYGEPVQVAGTARGLKIEEMRRRLEKGLYKATLDAQQIVEAG